MAEPIMGIQLYTLRDHIRTAEDFDKTLERLAKLGVKDVQISGIGDVPACEVRDILKKHGIRCCITHKDFNRMKNEINSMIVDHKTYECDAMGIGGAPGEARENSGNIRRFIKEAEEVAKKLKAQGMTFNYHNHAFEFNKLNDLNCSMMDLLIEETDPELFNFIPDVAWIDYGDNDPVEVLKKMKGRVKVLHFKDYIINDKKERHFVSLGKGKVDLKACYETAKELGIPYIMYEQDCDWVDDDPFKAVEESWAYMMSLTGK